MTALRRRVFAAFSADALLARAGLRRAAALDWRARAPRDAALCPWRLSALRAPRERRGEGRARRFPARVADAALRLVEGLAFFGAGNFTPARRALERPIAMACFAERAPCFPSRT